MGEVRRGVVVMVMKMRQNQIQDLIKKKKIQALISSHFMLSTKSQTIPSQKSCMYSPDFKIKKKKKERKKKNRNSYLSRWLLIYRLMYNINKLNRDQSF